jgi:hypothetical protein
LDKKFADYCKLLSEKGYFTGTTEGTPGMTILFKYANSNSNEYNQNIKQNMTEPRLNLWKNIKLQLLAQLLPLPPLFLQLLLLLLFHPQHR